MRIIGSTLILGFCLSACTGGEDDLMSPGEAADAGGGDDDLRDAATSPADSSLPADARPTGAIDASPTQPPDASTGVTCIPLPLDDSTMRIDGSLHASSPYWSVPTNFSCDGSGETAFGQPYYRSYVFCNTGPSRNFDILAMTRYVDPFATPFGTLSDPTLFLFNGASFPTDSTSCVAADNDSANTYPTQTIPLLKVGIPNGAIFTVVVSSFDAGDTGTYELWVSLDE